MSVSLRPLAPDEYPAWRSGSLERYAGDMAQNGGYTGEHARMKAEQDFERAMPDGIATPHQHYWAIEGDGEVIGHAWLGERESPEGARLAFVYEIALDETRRGRGHGRAAMLLLEAEARRLGHDRIELNVFGGNDVARGLYTSLGYAEVAVYMSKKVA